jgi:hypothetical protein
MGNPPHPWPPLPRRERGKWYSVVGGGGGGGPPPGGGAAPHRLGAILVT